MTSIVELVVASPVEGWRRLGLDVSGDGRSRVGHVGLRFLPAGSSGAGTGITGWTLTGDQPGETDVDGLSTCFVADPGVLAPVASHPVGASRIDHVVVNTTSLERTCAAIEAATGEPLKRIREVGGGVRQGFHRFGEVIVEVVERPDLPADAPASFWGFVLVVDRDLHEVCEELGPDAIGLPKPAVQPGWLIATVRQPVGLGLPVALMAR